MAKAEDAKELLIQSADKLFFERGYDDVNVSDICKHAGKAKGLFFYYFDKKETVVKVIADRQIQSLSFAMTGQMESRKLSGLEKMNFMMNALLSQKSVGPRAMYYFGETAIPDWFDSYAHGLKDKYILPILIGIVDEIAQQTGNAPLNAHTTEIVYLGISGFMHRNYHRMGGAAYYREAVQAIEYILETILKCPEGTINIT